jgi:transcription factor TFIIIB component B''
LFLSSFYRFSHPVFIEKGGPVFRPVAKSRSRPAADDIRQLSIVPDSDTSDLIASSNSIFPTSARPPEIAPFSVPNAPRVQEPSDPAHQVVNPNVVAPAFVSGRPSSFAVNFQPAIPSLASNTSSPTRRRLPQIQPVPISTDTRTSPQTQLTLPLLSAAITQPSHLLDQSIDSRMGLSAPQGHAVHETENTLDPSTVGTVAKPSTIASEVPPSGPGSLKKSTRPKSSREESAELPNQLKRRRKTTLGSDPEGSNEETGTSTNKPKRRATSGTPRVRKPSLPPFDADADPGEEIDPTVVTMASLCEDTGQGRVSRKAVEILENHSAWKAQNREKRARMKALMEQKKYGREETDVIDDDQISSNPGEAGPSGQPPLKPSNPATGIHLDDSGGGFDYSQDLATSRFNVQVRIGPNGETIIDEESLVVDRAEAEDMENYTHVVESDHTKFVNSGSYGKRFRGSRWSAEETESFYEVSQFCQTK